MVEFIVLIIFLLIGAGLLFLSSKLKLHREKYIIGLEKFLEKCSRFNGTVLDVKNVPVDGEKNIVYAVILQFRDEVQHKTIVHRYTGSSGKKYSRGDSVVVYYCDETDSACIKNDNPFKKNAARCTVLRWVCIAGAVISAVVGFAFFIQ